MSSNVQQSLAMPHRQRHKLIWLIGRNINHIFPRLTELVRKPIEVAVLLSRIEALVEPNLFSLAIFEFWRIWPLFGFWCELLLLHSRFFYFLLLPWGLCYNQLSIAPHLVYDRLRIDFRILRSVRQVSKLSFGL